MDDELPAGRSTSWGRTWRIIAVVLVGVAVAAGLAWLGFMLLLMVAFSSYGSNK